MPPSPVPVIDHAGAMPASPLRWRADDILALYDLPFMDLLYRAQQVHRRHFDASAIQLSSLPSIKTGGCHEACAYCPQSAHYDTVLAAPQLAPVDRMLPASPNGGPDVREKVLQST